MCSIVGWKYKKNKKVFKETILSILEKAEERGKDSFGFFDSKEKLVKVIGKYSEISEEEKVSWKFDTGIANFRAEPTTEYCEKKSYEDVQPFNFIETYAVHNGIIYNDKDLKKSLHLLVESEIDSAIIPSMWFYYKEDMYNYIRGSYAIAVLQYKEISLARNYNPIYIYEDKYGNIYFASLEKYLPRGSFEMQPYSQAVINKKGFEYTKIEERTNNKAVVICSGGLDSVTAAYWAKIWDNMDITLLHFRYGCKAESKEEKAIKYFAKELKCKYEFIDIDFLKDLGGSPIIDGKEIAKGEKGVEKAYEWVPARNTLFLGMVASYCDRYDIGNIYMGLNVEESGSYPDNSIDFYRFMEKAFDVGTISRPKLKAPFINKVKHEIIRIATDLEVPIEKTWSCYHNYKKQCGECGPCYMRKKGFEMNRLKDPTEYIKRGTKNKKDRY